MKWVTLAVFLTACIRANTEFLSPERYQSIEMDSVTVFMGPEELQADSIEYERVAMIFLKGSQSFTDQQGMIKKAREEAAKIGANGIVISLLPRTFGPPKSVIRRTVIAVRWSIKPTR